MASARDSAVVFGSASRGWSLRRDRRLRVSSTSFLLRRPGERSMVKLAVLPVETMVASTSSTPFMS